MPDQEFDSAGYPHKVKASPKSPASELAASLTPAPPESPKNCRTEPAYPNHATVVFSIRAPEFTAHRVSERCGIEEPHEIARCGEFVAGLEGRKS